MAAWSEPKKAKSMRHFVCDRCSNYFQAYRASTCPACSHKALWEFDREQPAREHAARIRYPDKSVPPLS